MGNFFKTAYSISELKPILAETKRLLAEKGLEFTHHKYFKSSYAPDKLKDSLILKGGIQVEKRWSKNLPDHSVADLLHEHSHLTLGHDSSNLVENMAPTKKSVKQELEASQKAIGIMMNTKGVRHPEEEKYLVERFNNYHNKYKEGLERNG